MTTKRAQLQFFRVMTRKKNCSIRENWKQSVWRCFVARWQEESHFFSFSLFPIVIQIILSNSFSTYSKSNFQSFILSNEKKNIFNKLISIHLLHGFNILRSKIENSFKFYHTRKFIGSKVSNVQMNRKIFSSSVFFCKFMIDRK